MKHRFHQTPIDRRLVTWPLLDGRIRSSDIEGIFPFRKRGWKNLPS